MQRAKHTFSNVNFFFKKHENNKKREYNELLIHVEHGTLFPINHSRTNGGMGEECQSFVEVARRITSLETDGKLCFDCFLDQD